MILIVPERFFAACFPWFPSRLISFNSLSPEFTPSSASDCNRPPLFYLFFFFSRRATLYGAGLICSLKVGVVVTSASLRDPLRAPSRGSLRHDGPSLALCNGSATCALCRRVPPQMSPSPCQDPTSAPFVRHASQSCLRAGRRNLQTEKFVSGFLLTHSVSATSEMVKEEQTQRWG